jgi:hypothetical protein
MRRVRAAYSDGMSRPARRSAKASRISSRVILSGGGNGHGKNSPASRLQILPCGTRIFQTLSLHRATVQVQFRAPDRSKEIGVSTGAVERHATVRHLIDQQPVRADVAFPEIIPISAQLVSPATSRKGFTRDQHAHEGVEFRSIVAALGGGCGVFFEGVGDGKSFH